MSDVTPEPSEGGSFFSKKISGIKTGYLVFGGLGLALIFYYWNKRKGAPAPPVSTIDTSGSTANTVSTGTGTAGGSPSFSAGVPQTNSTWARGALNAAIGNGSVNATDGANAVSAFLNGETLTPPQADVIAKLTTTYGQPPEGVLPINTTPAPAYSAPLGNSPVRYIRNSLGGISAQTQSGNTYGLSDTEWAQLTAQGANYQQLTDTEYNSIVGGVHNYVVQPGDTAQSIATRFYSTPAQAKAIPTILTPGTTIFIPVSTAG